MLQVVAFPRPELFKRGFGLRFPLRGYCSFPIGPVRAAASSTMGPGEISSLGCSFLLSPAFFQLAILKPPTGGPYGGPAAPSQRAELVSVR